MASKRSLLPGGPSPSAKPSRLTLLLPEEASKKAADSDDTSDDTSSDGSDASESGAFDVDEAIRRASKRASMRLRAESARVARRQALPALLAKLGPGASLDDDDDLTPQQMREQVQVERARDVVRDMLLSRRLLDPSLVPSSAARSLPSVRGSNGTINGSQQTASASPYQQQGASVSPAAAAALRGASTKSLATSAPTSPMALAAARRRQQLLDSPRATNSGAPAGGGGGGGAGPGRMSTSGAGGGGVSGGGGGGGAASALRSGPSRRATFANGEPPGRGSGGGGGGATDGEAASPPSGGLPRITGGGGGGGDSGDDDDSDGDGMDLGVMARSERRRLAKVQSKVSGMLRSQQRYQGLLANYNSTATDQSTLTVEELTASVIARPAKPPEGVELKVPVDDIRFSGVKLRFLMGLLEGIEQSPALCRTTADLVSNFVVPLTADQKCRLLDLIPTEHRGQPLHYVCHAWSTSARELLQTLRREMLPPAPPRPPPLVVPKPGGGGHKPPVALGPSGSGGGAGGKRGTQGRGGGAKQGEAAAGGGGEAAAGRRLSLPSISASGAPPAAAAAAAGGGGGSSGFLPSISGNGGGAAAPGTRPGGGQAAGAGAPGGGAGGSNTAADAYISLLGSPEAIARHYEQVNEKYQEELQKALDQVVWIDVVCNNQHSLTKKDYGKVAKAVVACGATILVLDTQLTPLTRTWCLFEMMHCIRCKRHLKVFRADPAGAPPSSASAASDAGVGVPPPPATAATGRRSAAPAGAGAGEGVVEESPEKRWDRMVETVNVAESKASSEADRVGILQEVLNTVGVGFVNDTIRRALQLSNAERARQLALRREQLRITMALLQPDPTVIGTEEYENNLSQCREHLQAVLEQFYPEDILRCIIPKDYVSNSARCWDMLCIFAEILERELFREDAKVLRSLAWLIFKRHSKRYIEVLYEKELDNWLINSLEHDRKWRRVQAKLKHDAQKKWN